MGKMKQAPFGMGTVAAQAGAGAVLLVAATPANG